MVAVVAVVTMAAGEEMCAGAAAGEVVEIMIAIEIIDALVTAKGEEVVAVDLAIEAAAAAVATVCATAHMAVALAAKGAGDELPALEQKREEEE